jgi:hypothetical protein
MLRRQNKVPPMTLALWRANRDKSPDDDNINNGNDSDTEKISVGSKRTRSNISEEDNLQVSQTTKALKTDGRQSHPRAQDFDDTTREIVNMAICLFRCKISSINPWPEHIKALEFAKDAWAEASATTDTSVELTSSIIKLVSTIKFAH